VIKLSGLGVLLLVVMLLNGCSVLSHSKVTEKCANIWEGDSLSCQENREREALSHVLPNDGRGLKINIYGTDVSVALTDAVSIRGAEFYKGEYLNGQERGVVHFDAERLLILSKGKALQKNQIYYIAPLIISNQGSGIFNYIGLFVYDKTSHNSTHLSSQLLGNRIRIIEIMDEQRTFLVKYYQHSKQQAYAEMPNEEVVVRFVTYGEPLGLHRSMHPSWDKNNDRINDCEAEGSCDHTVDYTVERSS